jgi:hypothetical protein
LPLKFTACKIPLIAAVLFGSLLINAACTSSSTPEPATATPPPAVAPTLAPGQPAFTVYNFTIPLPAGITASNSREMPGVGFTAIYNAPTLDEATTQAHFDELMPQLGFTPQGKVGPNLTYENDDYTLRVQTPGDGFLILTMLKAIQ